MLERISVHRVLNQVGADATVVEERVALAGRTVTDDVCALARTVDEKLDEVVADRGDG